MSSSDPRELTPVAEQQLIRSELEHEGVKSVVAARLAMTVATALRRARPRASSPAPDGDGSLEREAFSRATGEAAEKFDERDEEMSWVWLCAKLFFGPRGAAVASSPVPESSRDWVICLQCRLAWPWSAPEIACECSMANERTFRAAPVPVRDEGRKREIELLGDEECEKLIRRSMLEGTDDHLLATAVMRCREAAPVSVGDEPRGARLVLPDGRTIGLTDTEAWHFHGLTCNEGGGERG